MAEISPPVQKVTEMVVPSFGSQVFTAILTAAALYLVPAILDHLRGLDRD